MAREIPQLMHPKSTLRVFLEMQVDILKLAADDPERHRILSSIHDGIAPLFHHNTEGAVLAEHDMRDLLGAISNTGKVIELSARDFAPPAWSPVTPSDDLREAVIQCVNFSLSGKIRIRIGDVVRAYLKRYGIAEPATIFTNTFREVFGGSVNLDLPLQSLLPDHPYPMLGAVPVVVRAERSLAHWLVWAALATIREKDEEKRSAAQQLARVLRALIELTPHTVPLGIEWDTWIVFKL